MFNVDKTKDTLFSLANLEITKSCILLNSLSFFYILLSDFELQETTTCFIDRLMDEYAAYNDIIQPIQVVVYEMKFGYSLIVSKYPGKKCFNTLGEENVRYSLILLRYC